MNHRCLTAAPVWNPGSARTYLPCCVSTIKAIPGTSFPRAKACKGCHERVFEEWEASPYFLETVEALATQGKEDPVFNLIPLTALAGQRPLRLTPPCALQERHVNLPPSLRGSKADDWLVADNLGWLDSAPWNRERISGFENNGLALEDHVEAAMITMRGQDSWLLERAGAPGRDRTCDNQLRRRVRFSYYMHIQNTADHGKQGLSMASVLY